MTLLRAALRTTLLLMITAVMIIATIITLTEMNVGPNQIKMQKFVIRVS